MNLDKFGHHVHKRLRLTEFNDTLAETLIKTQTGDLYLKSSRLKGLQSPEQDDEAVNKEYLDKSIEELRHEMKKIHSDVKKYLNGLERATTKNLSTLFYTKAEVDRMIPKDSKNNE